MADLLNIGVSGLMAFQQSLNTTSHNISNVNTPGYSVQNAELAARQADLTGNGYVGNGVNVTTIQRSYDNFVATQVRSSSSSLNYFNTFSAQTTRINNLLADSTTGLSATLQNFVNAVQSVSNSPTSIPARQTFIAQAQALTTRLQSFDSNLQSLDQQASSQIDAETGSINQLAQNIAQLNAQIVAAEGQSGGQPPNDLLDQRDALVDQLSTHVNVNTVAQDDGSINVFVGSGQSLVMGPQASKLTTGPDSYDATRKVILLQNGTGTSDITNNLTGGSLGGMLDFRTQVLDPARDALGKIAVALASVSNTQSKSGMDLNGNLGTSLFSVGAANVLANKANTGTGTVAANITTASALTGSNYLMKYTATGWALQRTDTGASVPMTGTGTAADPFVADGMSIVVGGTPVVGDRVQIQPTRAAISGMQVLISDPAKVAAAAPIVASAGSSNTGTATITPGTVLDPTNAQLQSNTTITFTSATQYTVNGGPAQTYTSGGNIDVNGWRVQISGAPTTGDTFTVKSNAGGTGDNRNALALSDILKKPVLNGGTASLNDAVGQFVGNIGVTASQATSSASAQQIAYNDNLSTQQNISGVNLDEEAANLLKYQQAYQAAAQVIKIAQTLFSTLISATGG